MCYTKKMKYIVISTSRNICLKSQLVGIESQVYSFGMFNWLTGIQNITCMARVSICVGKVALRLLVWVESRWEWSGAYNNRCPFEKIKSTKSLARVLQENAKKHHILFCGCCLSVSPVNLFLIELIRFLFLSRPRRYGAGMSATKRISKKQFWFFSFSEDSACRLQIPVSSMSSSYKVKHVQNINWWYIDSFLKIWHYCSGRVSSFKETSTSISLPPKLWFDCIYHNPTYITTPSK